MKVRSFEVFDKTYSFGRLLMSALLVALFVLEPLIIAAAPPVGGGGDETKNKLDKSVLSNDQRIRQALARLTFGARPEDFERIKKIGVKAYLEQQLNPETIDDSALEKRLDSLYTLKLATPAIAEQYNPPKPPPPTPTPTPAIINQMPAMPAPAANMPVMNQEMAKPAEPAPMTTPPAKLAIDMAAAPKPSPTPVPKNPQMVVTELQRAKLLRAVYSEKQLSEMVVDFWENHFSIYAGKDADRWLMTGFDREAIRPFAMGRFRDLLGATAHSPAMLFYLDNWQSSVVRTYPATKDKPERKSGGINENYARELMELHTMGVGGGYTQKDVQEVARCFTGWTIRKPNEEGVFVYNPQMHDNGEKIVLGQKIPAGGGIADAERVLDILAKHPSTAKFIATKLARRFLGDNPPAAVISQAALVFLQTDGSISKTLESIINSPAFFSLDSYQKKIKSPFEFVAAALRITNAETDGNRPVIDWIAKMGQPIFGHITPEGYPDQSDEWLSNGNLLTRFNFANALATNKIKGTKIDTAHLLNEVDLKNPAAVMARLTELILLNEVTPRTKEQLDKTANEVAAKLNNSQAAAMTPPQQPANNSKPAATQTNPPSKTDLNKPPDYVAELLTLTLGAPEFQRK